ncbi:hypothetical protein Dcar01_01182 [Deinococcus carri]|uniref:Transposase n=1 Tax=Deinococcus carri TaxID=1211323 RepID=A0ABP9W8X9_9DEIO
MQSCLALVEDALVLSAPEFEVEKALIRVREARDPRVLIQRPRPPC